MEHAHLPLCDYNPALAGVHITTALYTKPADENCEYGAARLWGFSVFRSQRSIAATPTCTRGTKQDYEILILVTQAPRRWHMIKSRKKAARRVS